MLQYITTDIMINIQDVSNNTTLSLSNLDNWLLRVEYSLYIFNFAYWNQDSS